MPLISDGVSTGREERNEGGQENKGGNQESRDRKNQRMKTAINTSRLSEELVSFPLGT